MTHNIQTANTPWYTTEWGVYGKILVRVYFECRLDQARFYTEFTWSWKRINMISKLSL